ncbi:MAG: flavin reductase family protein [Deltaproteobacteria bacterium]|nr:flavin reductase family protein [Deltaproteobacteria bacterium]
MADKVNIGCEAFLYPMPVTLVGSRVGEKVNFMAVAWVTRVNFRPPALAVSLNKMHYTPLGILENRTYSVNVPGTDQIEETDYCGLVSGKKRDKSQVFEVFYGETGTAPMIKACPLCVECRLLDVYELPTNSLYIGEVVGVYSEERYLTEGKPDIEKIRPFSLSMPDNRYWGVGDFLGKAWGAGKGLKEARE